MTLPPIQTIVETYGEAFLTLATLAGVWALVFFACVSVGGGLLLGADRLAGTTRPSASLFPSFWAGFGALLAGLYIWNLFLPVNELPALLFAGLALFVFILRARRMDFRHIRPRVSRKWLRPAVFVLLAVPLLFVALVYNTAMEMNIYDTLLYHWPSLRWIKTHPSVPGLANLHIRLGTNTAWLMFAAFLDQGPFAGKSAWMIAGFFPAVCGLHLLHTLVSPLEPSAPPRPRLFALFLFPLVLAACRNVRPGLVFDDPAQLALVAGTLEFLKTISASPGRLRWRSPAPSRILSFVIPATVSYVIKPLGAPLFVLAGIVLMLHALSGARRSPLAAATELAVPGLLVMGWVARNAVLSGWLLFPAPVGPLPVDWRVPLDPTGGTHADLIQSVRGQAGYISGRHPVAPNDPAPPPSEREWLETWWRRNRGLTELSRLLPLGLFLTLLWIPFLRKSPAGIRTEAIALLVLLAQIPFWFRMGPWMRFGHMFFHLVPAWCGAALLAPVLPAIPRWNGTRRLLEALGMAVLAFHLARSVLGPLHHLANARLRNSWQTELKIVELARHQSPPLRVYVPVDGDQSGDAPLPATPYPRDNLRAREPGNIRAGYRVE